MVPCPKCQFMNPLKQKGCQACGAKLPYAVSEGNQPGKGQARATLRGLRSPESPTDGLTPSEIAAMGAVPPPSVTPVPRDGTMPSFVAPDAEAISKHRDSIRSTILGHGAPGAEHQTPFGPVSVAVVTPKEPSFNPAPQSSPPRSIHTHGEMSRPGAVGRTLLGHMVQPAVADERGDTSRTLPSMQAVGPDSMPSPISARDHTSVTSTVIGAPSEDDSFPTYEVTPSTPFVADNEPVAQSVGRASTRVGRGYGKPGPTNEPRVYTVQAPSSSQRYSVADSPVSKALPLPIESPESVRAANVRLGRRVLLIASALLLGLSLFALFWTPPDPPTARLVGSGEQTVVEVSCGTCDDGSTVTLGGQKGTFTGHRASVPLPRPLSLGYNDVEIEIERTGFGRNERMQLQFPVDYRLAWDLTGLEQSPPTLSVMVEAALGVSVRLDDKLVPLIANKGSHKVSIAEDVTGPSSSQQWLEKSVAVSIEGGRASTSPDRFALKIPIVPLVVDTPWDGFLTSDDTTVVSGRSTPNTKIVVAGNPTMTNADGYFEFALQTIAKTNTFTVAALAEGHAPRFVTVSINKVSNLHKAALEYQTSAVNRFDELSQLLQASSRRVRVALPGRVQESKIQGSTTVLLVNVNSGCPTRNCILRVVYPMRLTLHPNERIGVFGGATLAPGATGATTLPEVRAELLVR